MNYKISYDTWGKEELKAINEVIKTGKYSMGDYVKRFEKIFSKIIGKKYSVMTNSGSSANLIGVGSQFFINKNRLKRGDEVIVPAIGWSTTYSPLNQYGLNIKILDVDLNNFNINIDLIEKAISKKTKMICVVNVLGIPCDLNRIQKICNKYKLILYVDNCESLGSYLGKKQAGSFGDFSTHSFFFSHHISTIEGGMVSTNNKEIYNILKSLRAHGWTRDLDKKNLIHKYMKNDFNSEYKFVLPGYNLRPSEINGSIGIQQIKKLKKMVRTRRQNLKIFENYFLNDDRFLTTKTPYYSSCFAFPLILKDNSSNQRNYFFKKMKKNNIEYRLIAGGNLLNQPFIKYFNKRIYKKLKNAYKIHNDGFMIGNSSLDLSKNIKYLYETLKN
tara:strand:- start:550 stop:1710 length:1161 start_codon:yes stop_codon:yes gene_type:complete